MKQQGTRFDRIVSRIKNNPIIALVIVLGTIIIALSTLTDAAKNLLSLITKRPVIVDVTGKWVTQILTNPFDKNDTYRLLFDFQIIDDTILGSIKLTSTKNLYDVTCGIQEGKIKGNVISFHRLEQSLVGNETVTYKNFYYGSVSNDEIEFILQSDRPLGFPPQKFVAKRE